MLAALLSIFGALLMFVLVLALAYFSTKFLARRYATPQSGGTMRVLERTPLGTDRTLMVVRVGERVLLLGVSTHQINLICELDAADYPARSDTPQGEGFSSVLQGTLKNFKFAKKPEEEKGMKDE